MFAVAAIEPGFPFAVKAYVTAFVAVALTVKRVPLAVSATGATVPCPDVLVIVNAPVQPVIAASETNVGVFSLKIVNHYI